MKLFLFLDDWFLDYKMDIRQRFCSAKPVEVVDAIRFVRYRVIYDPLLKKFRAWGKDAYEDLEAKEIESQDGIHWEETGNRMPVYKYQNFYEQSWMYDPWDSDESRRYKMTNWPYEMSIEGGPGVVSVSPDGNQWQTDGQYKWFDRAGGSDTSNGIFYNTFRKVWSVFCRRHNTDRRVFITESSDLINWTQPRLVIHPDSLDPAFQQFYGMIAQPYENDYLIGALQCYQVPSDENNEWMDGRIKMLGVTDTQLTYSYEGEQWIRSDRTPLIERAEPGQYGHGGLYTTSMAVPDGDDIFFYSIGYITDHGVFDTPPGYTSTEQLVLHKLRRDGFACLEPTGGFGHLYTRPLVPQDGILALNYQAPAGIVSVQICDTNKTPIPGFTFEDCIPLRGDEISGEVKWKTKENLKSLIGRPVKIEIKMMDARLYAIKMESKLWFGNTPEPTDRL